MPPPVPESFRKSRGRWLLWLLVVAVLIGFGYHFYRVGQRMDWAAFFAALGRPGRWRYLAAAGLLMPLNWWLEARKWHLLLTAFVPWSFGRTVRAVLVGVGLSAATPNRVGEIGGRLLMAERAEWGGVVTSTLLGALCQWSAFLLIAWPALVWTGSDYLSAWLLPLGPLLLLAVGLGGKRPLLSALRWLQNRFDWRLEHISSALGDVNFTLMARASGYACLRFCVYCTQLYLLLWFFGLELPPVRGLAGIAAIYLVLAGIPLPPGLNLVTRTELGILLWRTTPDGAVAVLAAFTGLFAINVLLPALPGYWLAAKKRKRL